MLRGKPRAVAHPHPKPTLLHRRLAVVYDTAGPRVTFGVVWFAAVVGALVIGPVALVPLYAVVAGLAGFQAASAWRAEGSAANRWVALLAGSAVVVGAAWGVGSMGLAIVAVTVVALGVAAVGSRVPRRVFEAAGTTLQCGLPAGVGAAGVVLTLRLEIGAAVTLVLLVAAYEVGDYLVGSGASSSIEGPIAGIVAMAAICCRDRGAPGPALRRRSGVRLRRLRRPRLSARAGRRPARCCPRRRAGPCACAGSIPSCCSGRRGRSWSASCSRSCREGPGRSRRCASRSRRLSDRRDPDLAWSL